MPIARNAITDGIENWLVRGPIQASSGADRGAIAGWLDRAGHAAFYYGEITGYYLTCLEFASANSSLRLSDSPWFERFKLAEQWLGRIWRQPPPATRRHLDPSSADWRNEATFTFDLAMMLRGLSFSDDEQAARTRDAIAQHLHYLIDGDGTLHSHVASTQRVPSLPIRWSTQSGPFLVKAAAAILSAPDLPPRLRAAAEATVEKYHSWYVENTPEGDLHPILYHMEGLLTLDTMRTSPFPTPWDTIGKLFSRIMTLQADDGGLPPSFESIHESPRSDVMAQTLRMGALLVALGRLDADEWASPLRSLSAKLANYVEPSGCLLFERSSTGAVHQNVWCTIFAYQAFVIFDRAAARVPIGERMMRAIS